MEDYKIILGSIGAIIHLASHIFYFRGIYQGKTKPHAFTWLVWGVLNAIALPAVVTSHAGAGAWVLGTNVVACLAIAFIGFKQKHVVYDKYDWWALFGGIFGGILWWMTSNPLYAVILVSISDMIAMIPTFRKAYKKPYEENLPGFTIALPAYVLAILALDELSLTTWLYPVSIVLIDIALIVLILVRRKEISKK